MSVANPFVEFIARYRDDPVLMVREVFGKEPYPDQLELLEAYRRRDRRIAKRTGHRVGKSTSVAWIIVHHIICRFPQKTLVTAPTSPQLFDALASEVKACISRLPEALRELLEVQVESIYLRSAPDESFVSFRTAKAETPEAMAGMHSENMLLIGDEASGLAQPVIDAMSGSLADPNATMILIGNPVRTSGHFYDAFHRLRSLWTCFHTSSYGHPNVSPEDLEAKKIEYGIDSNRYRVRVLGDFPHSEEDAVIPFEWVETSLERDVRPLNVRPIWGLDVAYKGSDRTALAKRKGNALMEKIRCWKGLDNMQVAGTILNEWNNTPEAQRPSEILVDAIGYGAGVADRLRELELPCRGINVAELPAMGTTYANQKAELWFKAREWFEPRDVNLCGDDELMGELVMMHYLPPTSNGKIPLEPTKDTRKAYGGRSLDLASAFVLTFAGTAVSALQGSRNSVSWTQPLKRKIAGIT